MKCRFVSYKGSNKIIEDEALQRRDSVVVKSIVTGWAPAVSTKLSWSNKESQKAMCTALLSFLNNGWTEIQANWKQDMWIPRIETSGFHVVVQGRVSRWCGPQDEEVPKGSIPCAAVCMKTLTKRQNKQTCGLPRPLLTYPSFSHKATPISTPIQPRAKAKPQSLYVDERLH